jgi:hypothetical protein
MKKLKENDLLKISNVLEKLEISTLKSTGLRSISGGFAKADMSSYDDNGIDVELTFGCISDVNWWVEVEQYLLDRNTFEIIN